MDAGEKLVQSAALAALYARGAPVGACCGEPASRWPRVLDALRTACPALGDASACLRARGLWGEAAALDDPARLSWAAEACLAGDVITPVDHTYPRRWPAVLGSAAPPVVWVSDALPGGPLVGVVGSRRPSGDARRWLQDTCSALAALGLSLVSGGADGVDRLAASAFVLAGGPGRAFEALPCGLGRRPGLDGVARLSAWAPDAPFSTGQAMARNSLVYAASACTVVVQPRLLCGGTWAGAVDALRRRLTHVVAWGPPGCPATDALVALGASRAPASPVEAAGLVSWVLATPSPPAQPALFGTSPVREAAALFVA